MNQDSRVLGRVGARKLTAREIDYVTGGVHTVTVCTVGRNGAPDGDVFLGEC